MMVPSSLLILEPFLLLNGFFIVSNSPYRPLPLLFGFSPFPPSLAERTDVLFIETPPHIHFPHLCSSKYTQTHHSLGPQFVDLPNAGFPPPAH